MVKVISLKRVFPRVLEAKNKVDPVVEVRGDVVCFEGCPHDEDEFFCRLSLDPRREEYVMHFDFVLFFSEIDEVSILEKIRRVEELGDQFFDVRVKARLPLLLD